MIEIKGLTRRYGALTAVEGLNFSVEKGEICGFIGPNGAGKTTTIRMLATLLQQAADPWAGPVRALDMQRSRAPRKKKPLRVYTFAGRPAART